MKMVVKNKEFYYKQIEEELFIGMNKDEKVFSCSNKGIAKDMLKTTKKEYPNIKLYEGEITELTYIKLKRLVR